MMIPIAMLSVVYISTGYNDNFRLCSHVCLASIRSVSALELDTEVGPLGAPGHGGTALGGGSSLLIDRERISVASLAVVANQDLKRSNG